MEECILNDDEEEPPLDDSDEGEEDAVELDPHETDSEQDVSDNEESVLQESVEPLFIGKDQSTKWRKHCPPKNVRTRSENLITHLPGPKGLAQTLKTPISIWQYFFSGPCLQIVVQNTNKHIQAVQERYSRERDAKLTDIVEVKALIGLLYLAGVMKSSHLNAEDLWRVDGTGIEIFRLTMSLQRFRFLLRHLRFDDLETREARKSLDRLAAIRDLFDMFVENCKAAFTPFHYVTVDEKLEAFRGRCIFRQYIPSKPNKYGIKIYALCDSKVFYTCNLEVYVGKQPTGPWQLNNSPDAVVERLCEPLKGTGRNVTTDNWFSSFKLIENLKKKFRMTLVGTVRKNKRELPVEFARPVNRPEKSSMFAFNETCTLVSYIPRKKKNVLLMSSLHRDDNIDKETSKPEIIVTYNQTKGGVDTVDKLCSVYNCARSTRRWPMVIFYSMLNIAAINSLVIHKANDVDTTILRREFLRKLSFELIHDQLEIRSNLPSLPKSISYRIKEILEIEPVNEIPEPSRTQRGRCCLCDRKKNRPTRYCCKKCHTYLCLEHALIICPECFETATWD
nr:unnamed protein product [Callosobruchus analis]